MITVVGKQYKVVENLGYQGGMHAKVVQTSSGEKVVVKSNGKWVWYKVRLEPFSRPATDPVPLEGGE